MSDDDKRETRDAPPVTSERWKKGRKEGRKERRKEGRKEGRQAGRKEGRKKEAII